MINSETIKFILMIDTLSQLSMNGFKPLSDLKKGGEIEECVYYDDSSYVSSPFVNATIYKAVFLAQDDDGNWDEENTINYDDCIKTNSKYQVNVIFAADEDPYLSIILDKDVYTIIDGLVYPS